MSIADAITGRIEAAARERKEIRVPEWGDDQGPMVVFTTPMTIADQRICSKQGEGDHFLTCVYIIIKKLEDADGKKIFTVEHKDSLCKAHRDLVLGLAGKITSWAGVEDSIKN